MSSARPVPLAPPASDSWELDFYSRPVMGTDGKKLWELIITDSSGVFEHVEAVPNSMVNSSELRKRIQAVIDASSVKPTVIRYFRAQMRNMITIALSDIDVQVRPSRRTYALRQLLKYRDSNVYPTMPGYKVVLANRPTAAPLGAVLSRPLPDALRCEKFSFLEMPLGALDQFFAESNSDDYFGDACVVDDDMESSTPIPGLVLYSRRAPSIAGWMSGIELASVAMKEKELLFMCDLDTSFLFAQISADLRDDARKFSESKLNARGLHFLAVRKSEESDDVDGMWLLCDI